MSMAILDERGRILTGALDGTAIVWEFGTDGGDPDRPAAIRSPEREALRFTRQRILPKARWTGCSEPLRIDEPAARRFLPGLALFQCREYPAIYPPLPGSTSHLLMVTEGGRARRVNSWDDLMPHVRVQGSLEAAARFLVKFISLDGPWELAHYDAFQAADVETDGEVVRGATKVATHPLSAIRMAYRFKIRFSGGLAAEFERTPLDLKGTKD
jgi:hypothetical protein